MIVRYPSSVVRGPPSTIASNDISSQTTERILTKFGRNDPYMAFLKIVQMFLVHCIPGSHRLKKDFQDENFKKIFFSETTKPRVLIFGM